MIKLRIEFLTNSELQNIIRLLEEKYKIIEKSKIRNSNRENSCFKFIYLEVIER